MPIAICALFATLLLGVSQERREIPTLPEAPTVTARVVDALGQPVAHTHVQAQVEPADGSKRVYRNGATDLEGVVRFENLPAGQLALSQNDFNGGIGPKGERALSGPVEKTFRIPGHLSYAGRIVGEVCPDPWLTLETLGPNWWDEGFVRSARLEEDGHFAFSGLEPGRYRLSVRQGDHVFGAVSLASEFDLYESRAGDEVHVPLLGDVELDFAGRGERPGHVTAYLVAEAGAFQRGAIHHRSRVADLPYGRYRVRIREKLESRYGHRLLRDFTFELDRPELSLEVAVSMLVAWARVSADELPAGGIRGRLWLTDPSGHVPDDQEWRLTRAQDGTGLDVDEVYHGQLGTGIRCPGDRIELAGLAPGAWSLHAEAPGYAPLDIEFEARPDAVVDVPLERLPGRVLRVKIDDSRHEVLVRPVASAAPWKRLLFDAGERTSHTAPVGVFEAHLSPGAYELRVHSRESADTLLGPLEIGDDVEPLVIPVTPEPGHALRGRLLLASKQPADIPIEAPLHVWTWANGAWEPRWAKNTRARVDVDPPFTIQGLLPGRYRLTLDPEGAFPVGEFDMGDEDRTLDLVLER